MTPRGYLFFLHPPTLTLPSTPLHSPPLPPCVCLSDNVSYVSLRPLSFWHTHSNFTASKEGERRGKVSSGIPVCTKKNVFLLFAPTSQYSLRCGCEAWSSWEWHEQRSEPQQTLREGGTRSGDCLACRWARKTVTEQEHWNQSDSQALGQQMGNNGAIVSRRRLTSCDPLGLRQESTGLRWTKSTSHQLQLPISIQRSITMAHYCSVRRWWSEQWTVTRLEMESWMVRSGLVLDAATTRGNQKTWSHQRDRMENTMATCWQGAALFWKRVVPLTHMPIRKSFSLK